MGISREVFLPERVTDHRYRGRVWNGILRIEPSTQDRFHGEDVEEIRSNAQELERNGTVALDNICVARNIVVRRGGLQRSIHSPQEESVRTRMSIFEIVCAVRAIDPHQP